jgi:preprotein translocase subunit Sec61beta
MAQEKTSMPTTSAGIMRFYDVSASNILLDPRVVVAFAALVIVAEIILHVAGV